MDHDSLQPIIITNRRRRPRRRWRIGRWLWRVAGVAAVAGLAVLVVSKAAQPYAMRHRQKLETLRLNQALAQAREQNTALKHQIQLLQSGAGMELEARRLGYIQPGEVPLQISFAPAARKPG